MGTHGRHGQVRTQAEHADAQHQQHRAHGEGYQFNGGKIEQRGQRHDIHDYRDRQCGYQRFENFVF